MPRRRDRRKAETLTHKCFDFAKLFNPSIHPYWIPEKGDRVSYRSLGLPFCLNTTHMKSNSSFNITLSQDPGDVVWLPYLFQTKIVLLHQKLEYKEQRSFGGVCFLTLFTLDGQQVTVRQVFDSVLEAFYDALVFAFSSSS